MGTPGIMIPRDAAADRSNTNGTVGCNIPFTAGPGVIARVSTVGVSGRAKISIGMWTHGRHAARRRILRSRATDGRAADRGA